MAERTNEEEIAEIWRLFRETDARFKETDERMDRRFAESDAKLDRLSAIVAENSAEGAKLRAIVAETSAEVAKTSAELRKLEGLFGGQWGRLIEALVRPGLLALFQEREHNVRRLYERPKARLNGTTMEIDILLEDDTEIILVEVKSSFSVSDVDQFLDDLGEFTAYFPKYAPYRIFGAAAGLDIAADVARYAYRRGLFVLSVTGDDMVSILNDNKFRPRDFSPGG